MVSGGGQLIQSVQDVCDQARTSARLVQHSNGKVYAFDCHQWSMKAASLFRFQQPNAIVCVEQSAASLSGFVLVIEEKKAKYASSRIFVALTATMFVYTVLWVLYSHNTTEGGDLGKLDVWRTWPLLNFSMQRFFNDSFYYGSNKTKNHSLRENHSGDNCILKGGSRVDGNGNVCRQRK
jgi:hypothetical protein